MKISRSSQARPRTAKVSAPAPPVTPEDPLFALWAYALAYARFQEVFKKSGPFGELADEGASVQRPLWASTSTKNPDYPDTLYVHELIAPHTVNTMPQDTLEAFADHGTLARRVDAGVDEARVRPAAVNDMPAIAALLAPEGELVAALAEGMPEVSEDGLVYTFTLKPGAMFAGPDYERRMGLLERQLEHYLVSGEMLRS